MSNPIASDTSIASDEQCPESTHYGAFTRDLRQQARWDIMWGISQALVQRWESGGTNSGQSSGHCFGMLFEQIQQAGNCRRARFSTDFRII
jgi:hypothetical protein